MQYQLKNLFPYLKIKFFVFIICQHSNGYIVATWAQVLRTADDTRYAHSSSIDTPINVEQKTQKDENKIN